MQITVLTNQGVVVAEIAALGSLFHPSFTSLPSSIEQLLLVALCEAHEQEKLLTVPATGFPTEPGTEINSAAIPGAIQLEVHVMDILQLQARNAAAQARLNTFGTWWRVQSGYSPPPEQHHPRAHRPANWLLLSLTAKQQQVRLSAKVQDTLRILKTNDPDYTIRNICVSPREFNPKDYS